MWQIQPIRWLDNGEKNFASILMANLNEDQAPTFATFSTPFPNNRRYMTEDEFRKRMEDEKDKAKKWAL